VETRQTRLAERSYYRYKGKKDCSRLPHIWLRLFLSFEQLPLQQLIDFTDTSALNTGSKLDIQTKAKRKNTKDLI